MTEPTYSRNQLLQWGLDHLIEEMIVDSPGGEVDGTTSMGPRSPDRGNCLVSDDAFAEHALQWGLDHLIEEMRWLGYSLRDVRKYFNGASIT